MANNKIDDKFWLNFEKKISETLVPCFSSDIVRPCIDEDFKKYKETLTDNINSILLSLDCIIQNKNQWTTKARKNIIKVIVIVGEQYRKSAWNTNEIVDLSKSLVPKICSIFGLENIMQVMKDDETFLSLVMFLRPKLMKDTWKSFPAAVVCYRWILESVEKPQLKRYIPEILPTALIIFDDYILENQILGLYCIHLIIQHSQNSKSLKNLNYDEVIFQALEKMAHKVDKTDTKMIILLYSCISDLLDNIEYCGNSDNLFGWSRRDDTIGVILNEMELQTDYQCRYAYAISLAKLIKHSSIGKWSQRLTRVLSEYCEDDTVLKTTDASLNLLECFLYVYQPKSSKFYIALYSSLLKLQYKLIKSQNDSKEILDKVNKCMSILHKLCPELSKEIVLNDVIKSFIKVM